GTAAQINSEVTGSSLTITGGIAGNGFALNIAGSGDTTIAGMAGISGTGTTLTKTDDGALTLNAASTYSGATTISGGVINLQNANGFGNTSNIVVALDATANLQSNLGNIPMTINGTGAGAAGRTGALTSSGTNTYSGLITL